MTHAYTAWVSNDQGASEYITYNNNTSRRAILDYARRTYGAGWMVTIADCGVEVDCIVLRG